MADELNPRERRFLQEYLVIDNATEAYCRAYRTTNRNMAGVEGFKILRRPRVVRALKEARRAMAEKLEIKAERVLEEYRRIAFIDPRKVFKWGPDGVELLPSDGLDEADAAVVQEVSQTTTQHGGTIRARLHSKAAALNKLGQYLGLWGEVPSADEIAAALLRQQAGEGSAAGQPLPARDDPGSPGTDQQS